MIAKVQGCCSRTRCKILLHVSRGVRWDSDHVVTLTDERRAIAAIGSLNDARRLVANSVALQRYMPRVPEAWDRIEARLAARSP